MKDQNKKDSLRDLIVNNPRAQQRIDIKEIEKQLRDVDRTFTNKTKSGASFWKV